MAGELWSIIFSFFFQFFDPDYDAPTTQFYASFNEFANRFASFVVGYYDNGELKRGWFNLSTYFGDSYYVEPNTEMVACIFADILTMVTIICLIVLLVKLFKWIFNLIFKLFKLN